MFLAGPGPGGGPDMVNSLAECLYLYAKLGAKLGAMLMRVWLVATGLGAAGIGVFPLAVNYLGIRRCSRLRFRGGCDSVTSELG